MIVYCATGNPGKLREFRLAAPDFDVRKLPVSFPRRKKRVIRSKPMPPKRRSRMPNTLMGIYSPTTPASKWTRSTEIPACVRRVSQASTRPMKRITRSLLERLHGIEDRTARFVCVIALVKDGRLVKTFRGAVEGRILDGPHGTGGFGYDPLFFYEPFGCTFGEASIEQKMTVSHRAQALDAMFAYLRSLPEPAKS